MKILDEIYGAMNWQRKHEMIGGSLYCTVSIWDDQKKQWISKMDVGTESYTEKEKGQASDSFKRACVSIGIGRELYTAPFIWVSASKANIKKRGDKYCTNDKFSVREISYNDKREITGLIIVNKDGNVVYMLKPQDTERHTTERLDAINKELERTGIALDAVLKRYGADSIENMSSSTYGKALSSLRRTKNKVA
ncbi:MAG: hypothetical protein Q4G33_14265 [bacterium]|nr:hypothetical protein [bacterium]